MTINGLQKLTLLDFPGRTACTVFSGGCNFRCPFCHNASLVLRPASLPVVSHEELFSFLEKRRGLLDGVAVTGGEPTLQKDLPDFLGQIKKLGFAVKLDTNGTDPAMLRRIIEEGLADYAAMDVKSSPEGYAAACGITAVDLKPVLESISLLLEGRIEYEFRTTAVSGLHTPEDFDAIGRMIAGADRYFIQCFKDSGDVIADGFGAPSRAELDAMLAAARKHVPSACLRGVD
ncbi:MAG: anaerobic ribonucleoside-triphosphate reductase activating protein [Oscillospiraceae bacterium]|jgi:pyruvate formate lyase activating enzyme|nr:anaerobic ribonucleoside-triphosphate reductase activating protein [Oscillospiraceae bacterium]